MPLMDKNLLFLAADVARLTRRRLDSANRSLGITGPQWRLLVSVARHPGINQGTLADYLDVEPITTCRMIDRLEQARLVERRRDPQDRRAWRLFLTPLAEPLIQTLHEQGHIIAEAALASFSADERELLSALLERMRVNLTHLGTDPMPLEDVPPQEAIRHG